MGDVGCRLPILLLALALAPASALAQAPGPRVLVLAGSPERGAWSEALRIEIAGVGGRVDVGGPPAGDTPDARASAATAAARRAGADAAVWLEPGPDARLRLVLARDARVRGTPVEGRLDPRTVALATVSLLEDAPSVPPTSAPSPARAVPLVAHAGHALGAPDAAATSRRRAPASTWELTTGASTLAAPVGPFEHGPYATVGLSGFALMQDNSLGLMFDPGAAVRVGVGHRWPHGSVNALVEGGFVTDRVVPAGTGPEHQPWLRICSEGALEPDLTAELRFDVGMRLCGVLAELRTWPFLDGVFPDQFELLYGGISFGGFAGLTWLVEEGLGLQLRAELDFAVIRYPEAVPALAAAVVFE